MNKTIEEAAKDYAYDIGDSDWERMRLQDAFIDGINHIMQLPLCDRLTAEEKERVRKMYGEELGMAQHFHAKAKASNDISCRQHYYGLREPYISRMKLLERLFGADFFKEEE